MQKYKNLKGGCICDIIAKTANIYLEKTNTSLKKQTYLRKKHKN